MSIDPRKLQEIQKLLNQIQTAYDNLGSKNPFSKFNQQPIQDADNAIKQLQDALDGVQARVAGTTDTFDTLYDVLKGISKEINPKMFNATKSLEGGMKGLVKEAQKLKFEEQGIDRFNKKQLEKIKEKFKKQQDIAKEAARDLTSNIEEISFINKAGKLQTQYRDKNTKAFIKLNDAQRNALGILSDENDIQKDILSKIDQRIRQEEEVIRVMGAAPAILGGIGKALQKIGLPDFGVQEAISQSQAILVKKQQEYDLEAKINNTKRKKVSTSQAFNVILGEVGKKIKAQFTLANALQSAFTFLVTAMIQLDKSTGELAKNIGISYDESLAVQKNFNQIAISSDEIMVSSAEINKAFNFLNKQFGGTTKFSNELLQSFTALTAQAGFTEESIANIAMLTGTQGDELNNNVSLMQGELQVMNAQNKTSFSSKQLVEEIGNINKATLLTLRNQPRALARTLFTSKKLALSFAEMESIASSMLDFESSITNELEAELLTGKNLNLEQARLLALKGDVAGASAEIAKQVGSAADFEKMNVIQQEALAKAAGLTREQLAKSLIEREALVKLGGEDKSLEEAYNRLRKKGLNDQQIAEKLGMKQLDGQIKSNAIQARFTASVERMKEIFLDVGSALMPIVSGIADAVVSVSKFVAKFSGLIKVMAAGYAILKGIKITTGAIASINKTMVGYNRAMIVMKKRGVLVDAQGNSLLVARSGFMQGFLTMLGLRNAAEAYNNVLQNQGTVAAATRAALEKTILGSLIIQGAQFVKNVARGAVLLAQTVARAAAELLANSALTFGLGVIAALAAAAAGIAYLYNISKPKPAADMISPADGKTQISTKEGGLFELSKNDDLIAAPGIASRAEKREGRVAERTGENSQKIIDLLTTQNNFLKTIAAKSTSIIMNGNEVGQGINTSERAIQ